MRLLIAILAALAASLVPVSSQARPTPTNHTLPACNPSLPNIYMNYHPDTFTDDGGHTYGPATSLTCNPSPPQQLHIRYLPSSWTLAQADTYCTASGGDYVTTHWGVNDDTCVNVDY